MKKLLIGIFAFFIGFVSFSSATSFSYDWNNEGFDTYGIGPSSLTGGTIIFSKDINLSLISFSDNSSDNNGFYSISDPSGNIVLNISCSDPNSSDYPFCHNYYCCYYSGSVDLFANIPYTISYHYVNGNGGVYAKSLSIDSFSSSFFTYNSFWYDGGYSYLPFTDIIYSDLVVIPTIKVNYNNGSFTTVSCDGVNEITINGLSMMSSISTFTPYFNISYIDEDNQNLIESYDKDLLYLSGGQYHKTYTGDNQWILNLVGGSSNTGGFNIISSGLVVSGDMVSDNLSGNMFKSFIDTGFTVLFSNIPSYIQYVILIVILIVILRVFTKKRKKF